MEPYGIPPVKLLKADPGPLISATQSSKFSLHNVHSYSSFPLEETVLRGLGNITRKASLADLTTVLVSESFSMIWLHTSPGLEQPYAVKQSFKVREYLELKS